MDSLLGRLLQPRLNCRITFDKTGFETVKMFSGAGTGIWRHLAVVAELKIIYREYSS